MTDISQPARASNVESIHIPVNDLCNMGCTFCGIGRRSHRDVEVVAAEIAAGAGENVKRISFGGGEPTLHPEFETFVRKAVDVGFTERQVETNALRFSEPGYLDGLQGAGLTHARVMLPAATDEAWDVVTRSPGKAALAWSGVVALSEAGVDLDVVIPLSRSNRGEAAKVVDRLASEGVRPGRLIVRPVFYDQEELKQHAFRPESTLSHGSRMVMEQATNETLSFAELAAEIGGAYERAQVAELSFQVDAPGGIPLCALRKWPAILPMVAADSGGGERPAACGECTLYELCSGQHPIHRLVHGPWSVEPFRRIPPALNRHDVTETTLIVSEGMPVGAGKGRSKAEIRIIMPCNQRCTFCFVNRMAPTADRAELEAAVDQACEAGVDAITFTGGEPTLSPHLEALIARARDARVRCRGIQTNALKLAEGDLADRLVAAGLNHAHVSLHDVDPARYLKITGFGTPGETIRGAQRLLEHGVAMSISLVINQVNVEHVLDTVRTIHRELPGVWLVAAVAREHPTVTRAWHQTLVRYEQAGPALLSVLLEARAIGLKSVAAGTCGVPPCVLGPEHAALEEASFRRGTVDWLKVTGHDSSGTDLMSHTYLPTCETCSMKSRCPGIDTNYLGRYGSDVFRPI